MDKQRIPFGCYEVRLDVPGQEPPFLLLPRKFYEQAIETAPHLFEGMKATYMEPLRG